MSEALIFILGNSITFPEHKQLQGELDDLLPKHMGYRWTAEDASGANSIAWYVDYCKDPIKNADLFEKILTYNREDCQAMIVVKNFLASTGSC